MSIAARLRIAAAVPALMAVTFLVALIMSFAAQSALRQEQASAIQLRTDLSDLDQLVRAYLVRFDEEAERQYAIKDREMRTRVTALSASHETYAESAEQIGTDIDAMRSLFERIVENHKIADTSDHDVLTTNAQQRFATQLFIHSADANSTSAELVQAVTDEIVEAQRRIYALVTILTVAAAVLLTAGLLTLARNINRSLAALTAGTEVIGRGELEHRIGLQTHDELGALSDSFDRMSESLRAVTVSKAMLEQEVEERVRAEADLRGAVAKTNALLDAATAMASWTDLDELLEGLAQTVLSTTSHSRVTVCLWDEASKELTIAASAGEDAMSRATYSYDQLSDGLRHVISTGLPHFDDYDALPSDHMGQASEYHSHLSLQVPLRYRNRTVGVLGIDDPGHRKEFTQDELELVQGIGAQAAASVENARLFEASLSQLARTTVLKEAATAAQALDAAELSHSVLESFHRLLGITSAAVYLLDRETFTLRNLATFGYEPRPADLFDELAVNKETVSGLSVLADEIATYRFDDLPKISRQHALEAGETEATWVSVPVHVRGRVIGTITMSFGPDRRFSEDDIALFASLADQFGIALENARLYETERRIADRLQEALLSLPDRIPGIDFAHVYHSATESARVGGDFYDMFELEQNFVGITIGDVAGKGLDAAVLTSLVKNTIRAHASDEHAEPSGVLTRTNEIVFKSTPTESFVTVFFGVLDCRTGRLTYSSAGHTTLAILRGDGRVERLGSSGPILGAFSGVDFGQRDVGVLDFNELLFLYTDGLTEARRNHELYGENRLFDLLGDTSHGTGPSTLLRTVLDDVLAFSGGKLQDDLALMAVERLASGDDEDASHRTEVMVNGRAKPVDQSGAGLDVP